jgi:DNA-binding GntR family transcriptional regulator
MVVAVSPRRKRAESPRITQSGTAPDGAAGATISLRQQVSAALQQDILNGAYAPGQRLVERELVERFGVSSIPVREALQDMEGLGLVVKRPNIGCSVIRMTKGEVRQICDLRRLLEPQMIRWAVERRSAEAGEALCRLVEAMHAAAVRDDNAAFLTAVRGFHTMLWEMAGNRWAARAMECALGALFSVGVRVGLGRGELSLRTSAERHRRLLALVLDGHSEAAVDLIMASAAAYEAEILPFVEN